MLKGVVKTLNPRNRSFCSSNPYFLLNVEKQDPFPKIKAAFYKLAQEYHPVKNPSPSATVHFLKIKQAFEDI